jgi:hypothetical protein
MSCPRPVRSVDLGSAPVRCSFVVAVPARSRSATDWSGLGVKLLSRRTAPSAHPLLLDQLNQQRQGCGIGGDDQSLGPSCVIRAKTDTRSHRKRTAFRLKADAVPEESGQGSR